MPSPVTKFATISTPTLPPLASRVYPTCILAMQNSATAEFWEGRADPAEGRAGWGDVVHPDSREFASTAPHPGPPLRSGSALPTASRGEGGGAPC